MSTFLPGIVKTHFTLLLTISELPPWPYYNRKVIRKNHKPQD